MSDEGRAPDGPVCDGCGRVPRENEPIEAWSKKPRLWFVRTDKDTHQDQFACSRECIDRAAAEKGTTRVILPW